MPSHEDWHNEKFEGSGEDELRGRAADTSPRIQSGQAAEHKTAAEDPHLRSPSVRVGQERPDQRADGKPHGAEEAEFAVCAGVELGAFSGQR
nr:hypothetical protein [Mycobacteroides chelonae]